MCLEANDVCTIRGNLSDLELQAETIQSYVGMPSIGIQCNGSLNALLALTTGSYACCCCRLSLEGAHWDDKSGQLQDPHAKELLCAMPVILVRAVPANAAESKDVYVCPVYATEARFRQEVFVAQLRTKQPWIKWTLAGVALILDTA